MHFTETEPVTGAEGELEARIRRSPSRRHLLTALAGAAALAACGAPPTRRPPSVGPAPAPAPMPPAAPRTPAPPPLSVVPARSWDEYHVQAARRLIQANPGLTYMGDVPNPLLAIPVLEVELYVDGSIANIKVSRQPTQARDTVQLAIDAVRRAAPFPPVGHLPRPWKYTEVFLFDDNRRFKPRSLD